MFLYDRTRNSIYALLDWQQNAPSTDQANWVAELPRHASRFSRRSKRFGRTSPCEKRVTFKSLGLEILLSEKIDVKGIDVNFDASLLGRAVKDALEYVPVSGVARGRTTGGRHGDNGQPAYRLTLERSGSVSIGNSFRKCIANVPQQGSYLAWVLEPASKNIAIRGRFFRLAGGNSGKQLWEFTIHEEGFPPGGVPVGTASRSRPRESCPVTERDAHRSVADKLKFPRGLGSEIASRICRALVDVRSVTVRQVTAKGYSRTATVAVTLRNNTPWALLQFESDAVGWQSSRARWDDRGMSRFAPARIRWTGVVPPGAESTVLCEVEISGAGSRGGVVARAEKGIHRLGLGLYRPLSEILKNVKDNVSYVGYYGPQAASAVPELVRLLGSNAYGAELALVRIGPKALPEVLKIVADRTKKPEVWIRAIYIAKRIRPMDYSQVQPVLKAASEDPNPLVARQAGKCLTEYDRAWRRKR
jgi:hypothetical protein